MSKPVLPNDTTGPAFLNDPSFPSRLVQCWVLSYTVCKMNLYDFISWCYVDVRGFCDVGQVFDMKLLLIVLRLPELFGDFSGCVSKKHRQMFDHWFGTVLLVFQLFAFDFEPCHHAHSSQRLWRHSVLVVKWKTEIEHLRSWTQLYAKSKSIKYVYVYISNIHVFTQYVYNWYIYISSYIYIFIYIYIHIFISSILYVHLSCCFGSKSNTAYHIQVSDRLTYMVIQ